jgi:hypothetical protein
MTPPKHQAQHQHHAAEAFHAGNKRRQDAGKWNAPLRKILDHRRKIIELAPAGQHEDVPNRESHQQRTGPGKIRGNARGQQDQKIDNEIHGTPL